MRECVKRALVKTVKGGVSFDEKLSDHTTFRIGGPSSAWIEPESPDDLRRTLGILSEAGIDAFIIGNGSNILAGGGRLKAAVIRLSSPFFKKASFDGRFVTCGGGCSLAVLIRECARRGLSGLEALAGIPGTLGGAVMVNAGAYGVNIGNTVEWLRVMEAKGGGARVLKKGGLKFNYRNSNLAGYIILEARLALKRERRESVGARADAFLKKRRARQEWRLPNAGCVFKNPTRGGLTAGEILERCGLKGQRAGGAEISKRHANFIVNKGNASFGDVMRLIERASRAARERFNIELEREIEIIK